MLRIVAIVFSTLFTLLVFSAASEAAEPGEVVSAYYRHLGNGDYVNAASLFDPNELAEARAVLKLVYDGPGKSHSEVFQMFFGADASAESVSNMSNAEVFAEFLLFTMQQVRDTVSIDFAGHSIIGTIPEGVDLSHVVVRSSISTSFEGQVTDLDVVEVISLQLSNGDWHLIMKSDMKAVLAQVKHLMSATN